jgi:hypothetical protein
MAIPQIAKVKFNGGRGALLCDWCDKIIKEDFDPATIEDKAHYCGGDYCKMQDNCKHGWVFPDRCRFWKHRGCDCGAYGPDFFKDNTQMVHTAYCRCDICEMRE